MKKKLSYFAFGSNMHLKRLISWGVTVENPRKGILHKYELVFNLIDATEEPAVSFANVVPKSDKKVEGIVFETDDYSFEILDDYEGYPAYYSRDFKQIETENGLENCIVYEGVKSHCGLGVLPTLDHVEHILEGKEFLSDVYFKNLYEFYKTL